MDFNVSYLVIFNKSSAIMVEEVLSFLISFKIFEFDVFMKYTKT